MKPSQQLEALMTQLNKFDDERFNQEIQDHIQDAWAHLEDCQLELKGAGL
jgi:hypothetical protein